MKRAAFVFVLLGAVAGVAHAQRQPPNPSQPSGITVESILAVGKGAGACGILDLQL